MANVLYHNFRSAEEVLFSKGLLKELHDILHSISFDDHNSCLKAFRKAGWTHERLFSNLRYDCDAYKSRVVVEIEGVNRARTIDFYHRILFRFKVWHDEGKMDVGIFVTGTKPTSEFSKGAYATMVRDIDAFKNTLNFPLLLVGVREQGSVIGGDIPVSDSGQQVTPNHSL